MIARKIEQKHVYSANYTDNVNNLNTISYFVSERVKWRAKSLQLSEDVGRRHAKTLRKVACSFPMKD